MSNKDHVVKIKCTKTVVYKFSIIRPFNKFNRQIKANLDKKFYKCFNCNHSFEDNEMMFIGFATETTGNKVFCKKCAEKLSGEKFE